MYRFRNKLFLKLDILQRAFVVPFIVTVIPELKYLDPNQNFKELGTIASIGLSTVTDTADKNIQYLQAGFCVEIKCKINYCIGICSYFNCP